MYKLVSYGNEFFTNRDDKVRYGRFPSSSSPVSRTKASEISMVSEDFLIPVNIIFLLSEAHDFADD